MHKEGFNSSIRLIANFLEFSWLSTGNSTILSWLSVMPSKIFRDHLSVTYITLNPILFRALPYAIDPAGPSVSEAFA